jgi:hypothetical protein
MRCVCYFFHVLMYTLYIVYKKSIPEVSDKKSGKKYIRIIDFFKELHTAAFIYRCFFCIIQVL